jgi:hypothetical protein
MVFGVGSGAGRARVFPESGVRRPQTGMSVGSKMPRQLVKGLREHRTDRMRKETTVLPYGAFNSVLTSGESLSVRVGIVFYVGNY